MRNGELFSTLEIGALLPPWSVAESFRQEHEDAMHWMASNCAAFLDRNTLFLSLKQEYATVLFKNMESPLVAKARTCYTPECIVSLHKNSPAQCFTTSTPANIYQCFQIEWGYCQENGQESSSGNVMRDVFDATLVCLDSYHDCIMDHLNGALHLYNGGDNTIEKEDKGKEEKQEEEELLVEVEEEAPWWCWWYSSLWQARVSPTTRPCACSVQIVLPYSKNTAYVSRFNGFCN